MTMRLPDKNLATKGMAVAVGDFGLPVVVGGPESSIQFGRVEHAPDGSGTRLALRLLAPGVDGRTVVELMSWSGGAKSLTDYFDELAVAWRGWSGSKVWTDDGPNVSVSATHDGVGVVTLEVTADPFAGWDGPGSWNLTVRIAIEPGSLGGIAARLTALLNN